MQQCVRWPTFLLPLKLMWLGVGLALIRFTPLSNYRPILQTSEGFRLVGGPLDSTLNAVIFFRGVFEPSLTWAVSRFVNEGDVCVDGGANVGYFTLLMARCVGSAGRTIAIEAAPRNADRIRRNLALNGLASQTQVVNAAYTNQTGEVPFYVNRRNDMHCRLSLPKWNEPDRWLMGGAGSWRQISVPCTCLTDVLDSKASEVTFIKLDIEGAEQLVIGEILAKCTHPNLKIALEAKSPHIKATLHPFEAAGFFLYDLRNTYGWLFSSKTYEVVPIEYGAAYGRRHMLDVLLSRKRLDLGHSAPV